MVPLVPNYLVGKIIQDHSDEAQFGRTKLLDRLQNRVGATPFGMVVDAHSDRIYERLVAKDQFGKDDSSFVPTITRTEDSAEFGATEMRCARHGFANTNEER